MSRSSVILGQSVLLIALIAYCATQDTAETTSEIIHTTEKPNEDSTSPTTVASSTSSSTFPPLEHSPQDEQASGKVTSTESSKSTEKKPSDPPSKESKSKNAGTVVQMNIVLTIFSALLVLVPNYVKC